MRVPDGTTALRSTRPGGPSTTDGDQDGLTDVRFNRRGFAGRTVPALTLEGGGNGQYAYNRWMQFAGVDSTRVQVRGERVLYTAAGVILAGYMVYAFLGVFAFAHMATDTWWMAAIAAVVIGGILVAVNLSIDRGLIGHVPARLDDVDSVEGDRQPLLDNNSVKWARRLRVVLAILFALAVGEPANLFLFGKDVDAALAERNAATIATQRDISDSTYADQIAAQQVIIDTATTRIAEINEEPRDLLAKAEAERDGLGATGETGCMTQCRLYLAEADAARAAAPALIAAEQAKVDAATAEVTRLNSVKNTEADETAIFAASNDGFLAREQALISALKADPVLLFRYAIIVLVFFCLEMGAVLTKYLAKGNHYERESARMARLAEFASLNRAIGERQTIAHRVDLNRRLAITADEHVFDVTTARYDRGGDAPASRTASTQPLSGEIHPSSGETQPLSTQTRPLPDGNSAPQQ